MEFVKKALPLLIIAIVLAVGGYFIGKSSLVDQGASIYNAPKIGASILSWVMNKGDCKGTLTGVTGTVTTGVGLERATWDVYECLTIKLNPNGVQGTTPQLPSTSPTISTNSEAECKTKGGVVTGRSSVGTSGAYTYTCKLPTAATAPTQTQTGR